MVRHMLHHLRNNLLVNNLQRSLIDDEPVRPHNPRDQRLAQTPSRLDNNLRRIPIHRVESKDNTRNLRIHHLLDPNADEHLLVRKALLLPIENRTGSVQTRPALLYIMDQLLLTLHIEERVLLPSKRSVRQSLVYNIADPRLLKKATESISRNREPGRYADPFRGQLSEICAFPADQLNIVLPHLV